jgi:hypothetical protein
MTQRYAQRGQILADEIVQLRGEPLAFRFLRADQTREKFADLL